MTSENIKLDYSLNVRIEDETYSCPNGAEFFLDEHNIQWVKFVPRNGYAAGSEHIIRSERTIIIRTNKKAQAVAGAR